MNAGQDFAAGLSPLLKKCAEALYSKANHDFGNGTWHKLYCDIRFTGYSLNSVGASGVLLKDGTKRLDFRYPSEFSDIMFGEVADLRMQFQKDAFFGIVFVVTEDKDVDVTYDYDPGCAIRIDADHDAGKPF
jgi:hypothetical protein